MPYWLKIFLMGFFVGYMLCMFTGYLLILYDKWKEEHKLTQKDTNIIINERSD